ncbi:ABC transporter permease [Alkalibacter rhizosphaerae]|uniref:ABC transporter permease n=1 Tax=Alkalibacter rhizosphaerae TaxID=2815577 RepID=A0A975AJ84_9FIRM|nr:ABC transporter permease [Alkalibacter rhizosphaerae]QSX09325.1 ABC transporter permease [Alkalibacter rhizosphaerae]
MLYKNMTKTIQKKSMQLLAVGIILFFSSFIYTSMFYATNGLEKPTNEYLDKYDQEDFSVEMLQVLMPDETAILAQEEIEATSVYTLGRLKMEEPGLYDRILENRLETLDRTFPGNVWEPREMKDTYLQMNEKSVRVLFFKDAQTLNRSYIEEGRKPESQREIALSAIFAGKNDLKIGDEVTFSDRDYTITGFVLLPDYTFPIFDSTFIIDNAKQTVALLSPEGFEQASGNWSVRIAGGFENPMEMEAFQRDMAEGASLKVPFATQITLTQNQLRSGAIFDELAGGKAMSLGLGIFIAVIAILMASILIHKILQGQRGPIGLIKALGYGRRAIAAPYMMLVAVLALPMLLLGYYVGYLVAEPFKNLYLEFYLLPSDPIAHDPVVFFTAVLVPFIVFAGLSAWIVWRMLSTKPLDLLHPHREGKVNRLTRWTSRMLRKAPAQSRFKYLYAVRNTGKFLIFFLGVVLASVLILLGFMMEGMIDRMALDAFEQKDYAYEAYLDPAKTVPELEAHEEAFLIYPNAWWGTQTQSLRGLEADNELFALYNENGERITHLLEDGIIVTKSLALKRGWEVGETLTLNVAGSDRTEKIVAVDNDYSSDQIFMEIGKLSGYITDGATTGLFTGVYAVDPPSPSDYATIIEKEAIMDQAVLMQEFMQYSVYIMVGTSALIALIILFVLTSVTVEDNYYNISLLKVMGYSKKEVKSMVLNSYRAIALLTYLVSIPLSFLLLRWMVVFFAEGYNMAIPFELRAIHIGIGFVIVMAVFFIGTMAAKRKIDKIPLQEVLKAYQE